MTRKITVQEGDTLSSIALRETGNAMNWPRIYAQNMAVLDAAQKVRGRERFKGPDWIFPGTILEV